MLRAVKWFEMPKFALQIAWKGFQRLFYKKSQPPAAGHQDNLFRAHSTLQRRPVNGGFCRQESELADACQWLASVSRYQTLRTNEELEMISKVREPKK